MDDSNSEGGGGSTLNFTPADASREAADSIDKRFVKPRMRFNDVYEEYLAIQAKFDKLRPSKQDVPDNEIKMENDQLKKKIEILKRNQKYELRQAKLQAVKDADIMLKTKLGKAKEIYESEVEHLCR